MKTHKKSNMFMITAAMLVASIAFNSCSKKSDDPVVTPVVEPGAGDIAKANLVAHWGFEGNGKEEKSGNSPASSVNATYTSGAKGQALSLDGGYLLFDEITALNSLPSYTISAWVNITNTGSPIPFFSLTRPANASVIPWNGTINFFAESYGAGKDTMRVKAYMVTKANDNSEINQDCINDPSKGGVQAFKGANKWSHVAIVYDAATSKFAVYGNAVKISNPDWEYRTYNSLPLGAVTLFTPTKPLIGAWGSNLPGQTADGWQVPMTGKIDELRIWNKALSAEEIASLFALEAAGK